MTGSPLLVLGTLAATAAIALVVTALRNAPARRLAVRSTTRRPTESALVILGALLGTAIITGSLVVGDTLRSSIRSGAFTQLGPIDEVVTAPGADGLSDLREAMEGLEEAPAVDGVGFGLRSAGTAAARLEGDDPAVHPDVVLLEVRSEQMQEFGAAPSTTGLAGVATPATGEVAISTDLAHELGVDVGDDVTVVAYGRTHRAEVAAVLPQVGVAGYDPGLDARSFTVFLPPGTIADLASAGRSSGAAPPVALAFVSNRGGVLGGVDRSDQVTDLIRQRIDSLPRAQVAQSKQRLLDSADEIGSSLSEIFLGIGAFAVLAGVLLLINVFVMLAQERRGELGIMRAVGMQRGGLVRAFLLEGSVYAAVAAVLGAAVGIGVGAGIVQLARGLSGPAGSTLDLRFAADAPTIITGLLTGFLISLVTVLSTSVRMSRLNIIRAIRGLPEQPGRRHRRLRTIGGWTATIAGAAVTVTATGAGLFLGPALLAGGLAAVTGRVFGQRRVTTVLGALLVAWGVTAPTLVADAFRDADIAVFVIQGVVVTGAAVAVLARNQAAVGLVVRRLVRGTGAIAARLGLAYPLGRPFRTTMTLAMYALVVFTLVLVSLLAEVFGGQAEAFVEAEAGGYELLVTSATTNPLPPGAVRQVDGVETVAPLRHAAGSVEFRASGHGDYRPWFASGFDRRFLDVEPPALASWMPGLPDERSAWQHVLDDPSTMIVGSQFLQQGGRPQRIDVGDVIDVRDAITGRVSRRRIAGIMEAGFAFSGAFMSEDSLRSALERPVPGNRLYVATDPRAEPSDVAATIAEGNVRHGVEARTFQDIVAERQQQNRRFLRILQGYLMLGLVVGVAGLGVVMVRAVRERRREIGVLRSIGLQAETVGRSFMLEAGFITVQGTVVGALLATATAYQLIANAAAFGGLDVAFRVPWVDIATILTITLVASVVAAAWPARRASQVRPAVALRSFE